LSVAQPPQCLREKDPIFGDGESLVAFFRESLSGLVMLQEIVLRAGSNGSRQQQARREATGTEGHHKKE
jgi:hypothetical protein